ncbi:ABC transporter substrate-binding protein [Thalassospira sp. TSL5-1]|uniref:substrate-binding periplasmic protein n=1 Tax=Thalassospira sp. TSL5-1 TaxID=1544451 RepID=UPI00143B4F95|nr:transporter substrate-binding domain-containing protein [Thalassospira sp. TSL5-1]
MPALSCAGFFLFFLACCLLFLLSSPVRAQQTCQHIKAGYSYYPPFSYQTADGREAGASVEVTKRAFAYMNVDIELIQMPWARLLQEAKDGHVDLITAAYRTEERQSWASYSNIPIGYERIVAIHAQTFNKAHITLNDLRRKRGLIRRGDSHGQMVDTAIAKQQLDVFEVPEIDDGLRMVSAGRADYFLTSDAVARNMLKQSTFPELVFDRLEVDGEALYTLFSRKSVCHHLLARFNETVRALYRHDLMPNALVQYLRSVGSPIVLGMDNKTTPSMLGN